MAKVHNIGEMWQGNQNLSATQKECHTQTQQMTAIGYIPDTEEFIKASWSSFWHDGAAALKLSERSPLLPPFSAKDLPGERTQALIVYRIERIDCYPAKWYEDSASESISDNEN